MNITDKIKKSQRKQWRGVYLLRSPYPEERQKHSKNH